MSRTEAGPEAELPEAVPHLFRELLPADRSRLLAVIDPPVRTTLEHLLGYTIHFTFQPDVI